MNYNSLDYIIKTITVGNAGAGKTSLLHKLTKNQNNYYHNTPTIGVDFFTVNTYIKGSHIRVNIWDTAGHERYQNLVKTYYKNNAICYVIYDVCDRNSFKSVQMWINVFKTNSSNPNAIVVILANKIDDKINRKITFEEGKLLADQNDAIYIEISSRTSVNLDKMIVEPITKLLDLYQKKMIEPCESNGLKVMKIENNKYNKTKKCKFTCTIL